MAANTVAFRTVLQKMVGFLVVFGICFQVPIQLILTVKDINDHAPIFNESEYRTSVSEVSKMRRYYWPHAGSKVFIPSRCNALNLKINRHQVVTFFLCILDYK